MVVPPCPITTEEGTTSYPVDGDERILLLLLLLLLIMLRALVDDTVFVDDVPAVLPLSSVA
jgi:hypothetical protein